MRCPPASRAVLAAAAAAALLAAGRIPASGRAIPASGRAVPGLAPGAGRVGAIVDPAAFPDYAPSGMPDFSQCRATWSRPGSPAQWTHAGPLALADALWWLDSAAEADPRPPTEAHDTHGLVTAYPEFGPPRDDHSADNLTRLVDDLALRCDTNGLRTVDQVRGTRWESLVAGAEAYIGGRRLGDRYALRTEAAPSGRWLADRVAERAGTVLLLGVWEVQGDAWRRVGGHYAALVEASPEGRVVLADPLQDSAPYGGAGRAVPAEPGPHSCREAPRAHDDAAVVSHDAYDLYAAPGLEGRWALTGYFTPLTFGEAAAFQGQNPADLLADHAAAWRRGSVVMAIDAALAIVPVGAGRVTATATPVATPSPRATASLPTRAPTDVTPDATRTTPVGTTTTPVGTTATPESTDASPGPTHTAPARPTAEATHGPPAAGLPAFLPLAIR